MPATAAIATGHALSASAGETPPEQSRRFDDPLLFLRGRESCRMVTRRGRVGERRWPMAAAVLLTGLLRIALPPQLRLNDARPVLFAVLLGLVVALILADPGRIDREATWLRVLTALPIVVITIANGGSTVRLVSGILFAEPSPEHVRAGWYPAFVDYLHLSFNAAMAFSPTDVSAIKPWAKLMMMVEEAISVVVGILVVARAVNILK